MDDLTTDQKHELAPSRCVRGQTLLFSPRQSSPDIAHVTGQRDGSWDMKKKIGLVPNGDRIRNGMQTRAHVHL